MRITDRERVRSLFDRTDREGMERELADLIGRSGALLEGHFRLQSGHHSRYFLRFAQLAFRPDDAEHIARLCVDAMPVPPAGAVLLAVETAPKYLADALAKKLDLPLRTAKAGADRRPTKRLKGEQELGKGRDVVIVTDVMNTGSSVKPLVELARSRSARSVHVLAFATLHGDGAAPLWAKLGVEGTCLMNARWPTFHPDACEICGTGAELLPAFEFN